MNPSIPTVINYKVVVTAIVEREEVAGGSWEILEKKADGSEPRGYTPQVKKIVRREEKVFEQTVDTLNMAGLVLVVNKLPPA